MDSFQGGLGKKEGGGAFEGGGELIPQRILWCYFSHSSNYWRVRLQSLASNDKTSIKKTLLEEIIKMRAIAFLMDS